MARLRPILALCVAALVATIGLAMGAQLQKETPLAPNSELLLENSQHAAAGDVILLTGLLVAGAATAMLLLLAPPSPRRVGPACVAFLSTYLLVNLAQTAWPNLTGIATTDEIAAQVSVNLIAFNGPAVPSVFLPVFALLCAGLLGVTWAARRLLRPERRREWTEIAPIGLGVLLARWLAALALALPFLAIASASSLRLLVEMPGAPGQAGGVAVLAFTALVCLGLIVTTAWKALHLAAVARNPRIAPVAQEAWQGLSRAEGGLMIALAVISVVGAFLPKTELGLLQPGLTFGVTLRSHTGFLAFLLLPLVPVLTTNRAVARALAHRGHTMAVKLPRGVPYWTVGCCVAATLAAFLASWLAAGALWGWIVAGIPAMILAIRLGDRAGSTGACLVLAYALWALGNSHAAAFQASTGSNLDYAEPGPGLLAVARLLGALVGAVPVWRLVAAMAAGEKASTAIPLAAGAAAAAIGIVIIELPLSVWVPSNYQTQWIGMGSMVAAQGTGAAWTMHVITFLLVVGMALAAARAVRPDWFGRSPPWARSASVAGPTA